MKNTAHLSRCRKYRYALWRTWDNSLPRVMFIGLNPSTADEILDDPTLIRCQNFARSWGYGGVCIGNLFAFRATQPADMLAASDPVGSRNNHWLKKLAAESGLVIGAWGNDGNFLQRSSKVRKMIPNLHCLAMNKTGEPAHPLYQRSDVEPFPMSLRAG
jgi:hypothetical protein